MSVQVIRFAPGLKPVLKHLEGQHDQSTHGSWASETVNNVQSKPTPANELPRGAARGKTITADVIIKNETFKIKLQSEKYDDDGTTIMNVNVRDNENKTIARMGTSSQFVKNNEFAKITGIEVATKHQRKGIATIMLMFAREHALDGISIKHDTSHLSAEGKAWADVTKHGTHDQSTHGSWAEGSQGSASELSDDEIRDVIYNSKTVNEMFQKVAKRQGKSMKPSVDTLSENEITHYRGVQDVTRDAQRLLDGEIKFTEFQTWGQGIYISSEKNVAQMYGELIGLKLDKSVRLVEGETAWSKAFEVNYPNIKDGGGTTRLPLQWKGKTESSQFIDMQRITDRILAGKMDNLSVSDMWNVYWASKGYDGYSTDRTSRAEVILFNGSKLTVNKADIGTAVKKHLPGGHEQKDHGSWAVGGGIGHLSESTAKEIEESTALFQDLMGADVDIKNTLTGYGWESEGNWETLNNRLINRYMESGLGKNTAILQARIDMGRVGYAMKNADEKANYEETITKNRERAVLMGDEYAQSYGQEADQMEKGLAYAKEQVTNAMKNGDVTIAMSEYVLDSVLVGGRYKNQFETRTSGGKLDVGVRKVGEGLATGTPAGTKLADRPVYGYLTNNETVHTYESKRDAVKALEGEWSDKHTLDRTLDWQSTTSVNNYRVDQYGDIRVILKSDVRGRTTVTIGDSLRTGVMADGMSNPKPDLTNMGLYKAGAASHMSGNPTAGYLEAQIHGGVKASDISRIYAPRDRVESIELSLSMRGLDIPVIARKES